MPVFKEKYKCWHVTDDSDHNSTTKLHKQIWKSELPNIRNYFKWFLCWVELFQMNYRKVIPISKSPSRWIFFLGGGIIFFQTVTFALNWWHPSYKNLAINAAFIERQKKLLIKLFVDYLSKGRRKFC